MIKIRGSNPVFSLKLHITSDESIGHSWHVPTVQNCLKFMQFFGKFGKSVCWYPPEGWCPLLWGNLDLSLITLNILTNSQWFCLKPSQQGLFLWDNQNKGLQPYILTAITHTPKCLHQFLKVLLETFTIGLNFVRQSKQGATTLCFNQNYVSVVSQKWAPLWKFWAQSLKIAL